MSYEPSKITSNHPKTCPNINQYVSGYPESILMCLSHKPTINGLNKINRIEHNLEFKLILLCISETNKHNGICVHWLDALHYKYSTHTHIHLQTHNQLVQISSKSYKKTKYTCLTIWNRNLYKMIHMKQEPNILFSLSSSQPLVHFGLPPVSYLQKFYNNCICLSLLGLLNV